MGRAYDITRKVKGSMANHNIALRDMEHSAIVLIALLADAMTDTRHSIAARDTFAAAYDSAREIVIRARNLINDKDK